MNIKHLYYFKILFEEKNLHSAAQRLFITPQGLSKTIHGLEDEYGQKFFVRKQSGMDPTRSGFVFYEYCNRIQRETDAMEMALRGAEDGLDCIHAGLAAGVLKSLPDNFIGDIDRSCREHGFTVHWSEYVNRILIDKVRNSQVDYGICVGREVSPDLVQKKIFEVEIKVFVYEGHPLWDAKSISIDMLKDYKILTMSESYHIYNDFVNACHQEGFEPDIAMKLMDADSLYLMCRGHQGIAISPDFANIDYPDVRKIPVSGRYTWDIYDIYLKKHSRNKNIKVFREELYKRLGLS